MKKVGNWVFLDLNKLSNSREERIGGVWTQIAPAPFDLPVAVRPSVDTVKRTFHLEIRYLANSEPHRTVERNNVTFYLGKESGRLHGLDFSASLGERFDDAAAQQFVSNLENGLQKLMNDRQIAPRAENYRVMKEVLSTRGTAMFQPLADQLAVAH